MFCAQRQRLFWGPLVAFCFGPFFRGAFLGLDLVAHRPHSRPDWFGLAQRHKGLQYPNLNHWSQQLDWVNNDDNYKLTNVM